MMHLDSERIGRFPTLVADVIADRRQARALTALLVTSLVASAVGAGAWPCPIYWALGVPCPGCGLSRGALALLAGHGSAALAFHPLAPLGLFAGVLLVVAALLPARALQGFVLRVRRIEGEAPLDLLVAIALFAVWALRLVSSLSSSSTPSLF